MSPLRRRLPWLLGVALACLATQARADGPADPLRLVPANADAVVKVEDPRQLVQAVLDQEAVKKLWDIEAFRELYDSTTARRFYQLLAHVEKKLGANRMEIIDGVAGGGIVLALKYDNTAVLVVQGKDEKMVREFARLGVGILEEELARQDSKEALKRKEYRGVEAVQVSKDAIMAVAGSAIVISNKNDGMKAALDLHADGPAKSILKTNKLDGARKILPGGPAVWAWFNLEPLKTAQQAKDFYAQIDGQAFFVPFLGAWPDVARRSPFVAAGLYQKGSDYHFTVRMPRGREGMHPAYAVAAPPAAVQSAPPLLEPKDVILSASYYFDLARIWEGRDKLLTKEQAKGLEQFEKNSGRFLGGIKLGKLLGQAGPYQRVVAVQQDKSTVYKKQPQQPVGAFALVQDMRDKGFARSVETLIRTGALFATTQFSFKMSEEKRGDVTIVSYRFTEDGKPPFPDPQGIRFGFTPSFAEVGDQMVFSSTVELARELVDLLQKEKKGERAGGAFQVRAYSRGVAASLRGAQDQLITQAVLGQALEPEAAREQVQAALRILEGLGNAEIESVYGNNEFRFDVRLSLSK